jgi:hypothetical protein
MSERDKATEEFVLYLGSGEADPAMGRLVRTDVYVIRESFKAGWDAAYTAGRLRTLREGVKTFRGAWEAWGDVNDLTQAEALEAQIRELEAGTQPVSLESES